MKRGVLHWAWHHGPVTVLAAVLLALGGGWLAGLGGGHHPGKPPHAEVVAEVTAAGLHGDLAAVLADQRQADADHREAWIADGYSSDLQVLVDDTDQAGGNPGRLDADARAFSDDGYAYLSAAGLTAVRPPPGWQPQYAQLRADLNALARDAGLAPVPAPRYPVSASPGPANPPVPVHVPAANACVPAGTTSTSTSSSNGSHSQSTKTSVTCGTATSSTTHKTAVSAKGVTTTTTTNSTKTTPSGSSGSSSGSSGP